MQSIVVSAKIEEMNKVTEFVSEILEEHHCSMKARVQIEVGIDEIMSNIIRYAYEGKTGDILVECDIRDRVAYICCIDSGRPYNPLTKEDPDVTLSVNEREIGGLGIFMVKKSMDDLRYEYRGQHNQLTMMKRII